jgi:predicted alpha/beta hydrolase
MLHTIGLHSGASLALRRFEPACAPVAAVVVPSAMGVTQNFYARFAEWLAACGYLAATFDYRGIGQSAPATLRGFQVDIRDWATQDCPAVIEFIKARAPSVPRYWIGHSLGGCGRWCRNGSQRADREKITCAMSPPRTSASEMAQGDGQPPSSAS